MIWSEECVKTSAEYCVGMPMESEIAVIKKYNVNWKYFNTTCDALWCEVLHIIVSLTEWNGRFE